MAGGRGSAPSEARTLAKEVALSLLTRSIAFGHGRLAVIRLAMAVQAGADVPQDHWLYCREAATSCKDEALHRLFIEATQSAQVVSNATPRIN